MSDIGGLFIRTTWHGEEGFFQISTSMRLDVCLNPAGLRNAGLRLLRERDGFSVYEVGAFRLLDRLRGAGEITAFPGGGSKNIFGRVGVSFFREGMLAIDPAGPDVAHARRSWEPHGCLGEFEALPHLGESGLPLTQAIRFAASPGDSFVTLLASDFPGSYASPALMDRLRPNRRERRWRTELLLPSGQTMPLTVERGDIRLRYAVDIGVSAIDMVIGMNFLRRGFTIMDWTTDQTWFGAYGR